MNELTLRTEVAPVFSYAFQQNQLPLISRLDLSYIIEEAADLELDSRRNLKVILTSDPEVFKPEIWHIDEIASGQTVALQKRNLSISNEYLNKLTEQVRVNLKFEVFEEETSVAAIVKQTSMCPKNHWAGESLMAELLAAFVTPNACYVEKIVRKASDLLKANDQGSQLDGYQSETRERPYIMAAALWNVICAENIAYVSPPASFASSGQRIRLPDDIEQRKTAACLDLSTLFAACLEHIGLNPIIALTNTHACCGFWLINDCFGLLTNDDSMDVRKRCASKDLVLFETTMATSDISISFNQSIEQAENIISEGKEADFVFMIDIAQARKCKIRPLPTLNNGTSDSIKSEAAGPSPLPIIPVLPPVRKDELPPDDTPEGRVDQWQRKLLDLTKRNRLLNFSTRSVAIRLFCSEIGEMEDILADGQVFNFLSPSKTPYADSNRDMDLFRFSTGNDLQVEFAKEQLKNKTLIANESEKVLEKNLLSLFRKAKNDLEEGGANTLYLAIGMLKWKENSQSDRTYRAPLIMIPVELIRNSARSKIRVKQRLEEEPTFNSTLIEFLQADYEIDISRFNRELPVDDSGIDVDLICDIVRDKVKDIQGFEVVNELVLGTFSFAKYLMWKDLRDRVDDLKTNPFVEHLIDNPQKPYAQETQFIEPQNLDELLKPSEVFAPLNADSSQLITIDASAKKQDFVLEGPPGTGKSETIANIIAHNIAKGRKVLFVAEKMAALNVVYRRLEKAGLDHLCLELHSNKANKRAVLDQLKKSWVNREQADKTQWEKNADRLFKVRTALNSYINELHKKSQYGLSARQAISRISRFQTSTKIALEWPSSLETAPIRNEEDLERLYDTSKKIGLAFVDIEGEDLSGLSLIAQSDWSNAWQRELIQSIRPLQGNCDSLTSAYKSLLEQFTAIEQPISFENLSLYQQFAEAILDVTESSMNFTFEQDVSSRLAALKSLAQKKEQLDAALKESNFPINMESLSSYEVDNWITSLKLAEQKFALIAWFDKRAIKKKIQLAGLIGTVDLAQLDLLKKAQDLAKEILKLSSDFESDKIWQGWNTAPNEIKLRHDRAKAFYEVTRAVAARTDAPVDCLKDIKEKVVDGREFLIPSSPVMMACQKFIDIASAFLNSLSDFKVLGGSHEGIDTIGDLSSNCQHLLDKERKINNWCNWLESKNLSSQFGLEPLVDALERGVIPSNETVMQTTNAFCQWLAPILVDQSEVLRTFHATSHESLIEEFRELDSHVAITTADYICAVAASGTPEPNSPTSPEGYGVLAREFNKKSNHKPIRTLIEEMGGNLLQLTPCMMMSPLSVAQFLPPNFNNFDLVVFDEASQITVWDAVGAIARGKNVIVVGDPKQMPPTSFFAKSSGEETSDEEDLESILDQALSARIKHHRLTGHYRSRHESLIAFSNTHYYENSLVTFPCAQTKQSAVTLHRVDGLYAKGKGRNNPVEAQKVADFIVQMLLNKKQNHLTIGVVTLNSEQQRCIEDCLDAMRRKHPEIEPFFQATNHYDPVFVKNLESVQGDERDIIILSLGYGPTEPHAKTMSMNFGPLNKQGGERRLNVAITRSTTEVHVFSSFDSSMIDLSRTSARAVQHLKTFIEFAEKGPVALAEYTESEYGVDQFDSHFEEAVALALRDKGWKVQTQVGVSKFRIDLGIIHPEKPGNYLAGIECDGATYHGSPAARDRDRVRHIILEGLGWNLIRIWSTDYFIDPDRVIEKVNESLCQLLESSESDEVDVAVDDEEQCEEVAEESSGCTIDAKRYFDDEYNITLETLAKEILVAKSGITMHELASDIGWQHDLSRTTKKQVNYIESIVRPWAGIAERENGDKTVWLSPDEVVSIIEWRGLAAFGFPRDWNTIPYPERLGLAKFALAQCPDDPAGVIFSELGLNRRTQSTERQFESWISDYQQCHSPVKIE